MTPENEHHQAGAGEIEALEHAHVDDRSLLKPLPDHQRDQADGGHDDQRGDEVRAEPIVFLAFVEQDLQRADTQREQRDADIVELDAGRFELAPGTGDPPQSGAPETGQHADGKIDVENPAPGIVEGDPAAEGGPDGGRHDRGDAVEREGQAALLRRKSVGQNGLRHGLQPAAARALQHAEEQQHPETGRSAAQQRTHGEDARQPMKKRLRPKVPASHPLMGRMMALETR